MIHDAPGDPPRPSHHQILDGEQTRVDHAVDVLPKYRRMMEMRRQVLTEDSFRMALRQTTL